ncbi:MAG: 2-phospho-L-lactate guanylyltransferase [Hyphomonadaceae bacterium]|nr:2-phospho-L-lactate guanylyltransferase [Hyphomonadaceae bacterium]
MSGAAPWAIVPVKSLDAAKQRLKAVLPLEARRRLMRVMLEDVLATLGQVEGLGPVLVVTPDALVAELAASAGAHVLREAEDRGHSAAAIAGFRQAQARGATRALTLPADAPLVTAAELDSLIAFDAGLTGPHLTLVPAHDGDGTNGFLASPPELMAPSFGPGSFARHRADAAGRRIACHVHELPGLALDIDAPGDLARLMAHKQRCPRYDFLGQRHLETTSESER